MAWHVDTAGVCSLCGFHTEDTVHTIFKCPKAQQVWLCSQFGLRTDNLPDSIDCMLNALIPTLSSQQISLFFALAWCLWKARCKKVSEGTRFMPQQVVSSSLTMAQTLRIAPIANIIRQLDTTGQVTDSPFVCYSDGSWISDAQDGAGVAFVILTSDQHLLQYGMAVQTASSLFHAEVKALKLAV
ncbi:hypothetical protein LUZ62_045138 [Rhynchospora pubera]|uniref:Reverse transcriptase zinc-binding domain-containing protein n=1 Tax=Rhynchospora pubera TaxID=906938 RepID=A0AAV8FUC6_9POAL|nr:hypothetical protein LUZ62_045138 [Rhynchospora pubera]